VKLQKIIELDKKHLYQNYGRRPISFVKGNGPFLYDQDGKEYIDFFAGIAVCGLGYKNSSLSAALHAQVDKLIHSSNHFYNYEQAEAASLISELSFPGKTLFCNSGTEANEAAIKLARRYGLSTGKKRFEVVSFINSFHGRTMGSMTATGQEKIHAGFGPLPAGFKYLENNNISAFKKEVKKNKNIAAVMLELIQGEGGVVIAADSFIKELFDICAKKNIITIVDEIQTGIGRTGMPFAYQHYGVIPDVITLAKGLGGGVPIGAMHTKDFLSAHLGPGTHGSTFGGNHLACAAAAAVLKELKKPAFFKAAAKTSSLIMKRLEEIKHTNSLIKEIRGKGLLIGIELEIGGADIVNKALARGLIINCTAGNVIRLAPPLNIPITAAEQGIGILKEILTDAVKE
jgi:predicted acetylornithine/succinylornithine family transaminase